MSWTCGCIRARVNRQKPEPCGPSILEQDHLPDDKEQLEVRFTWLTQYQQGPRLGLLIQVEQFFP